jgi:hypothetical protein
MKKLLLVILGLSLFFGSCTKEDEIEKTESVDNSQEKIDSLAKIKLNTIGNFLFGTKITDKKGIYATRKDSLDIMHLYGVRESIKFDSYVDNTDKLISDDCEIIVIKSVPYLRSKKLYREILKNENGKIIVSSTSFYKDEYSGYLVGQSNVYGHPYFYLDFSKKGFATQWYAIYREVVSIGIGITSKQNDPAYHIIYNY